MTTIEMKMFLTWQALWSTATFFISATSLVEMITNYKKILLAVNRCRQLPCVWTSVSAIQDRYKPLYPGGSSWRSMSGRHFVYPLLSGVTFNPVAVWNPSVLSFKKRESMWSMLRWWSNDTFKHCGTHTSSAWKPENSPHVTAEKDKDDQKLKPYRVLLQKHFQMKLHWIVFPTIQIPARLNIWFPVSCRFG